MIARMMVPVPLISAIHPSAVNTASGSGINMIRENNINSENAKIAVTDLFNIDRAFSFIVSIICR